VARAAHALRSTETETNFGWHWTSGSGRFSLESTRRHATRSEAGMKLGKMLSVGEVVETAVTEEPVVAEPTAPVAERVTSLPDTESAPAPAPVHASR